MMESLGESTYIVPFRASRPRRTNTTATNTRRRAVTLENHYHTSASGRRGGGGGGASLLANELTSSSNSRTRSDSTPPFSPPRPSITTDYSIGDTTDDSNSAVGHRGHITTIDTHASLSSTLAAAAAALDIDSGRELTLMSAHWPQAQSDSELYSASLPPTAARMSTTTATMTRNGSSNNTSSNTTTSRDNNNNSTSDTITYPSKQEQEQEQEQVEKSRIEDDPFDPDCAICLDKIQPVRHAKAILACRHEFHLSCISMAFAMGKEMICPLCRYLHKDQPFMTLEADEDLKPASSTSHRRSSPPPSQSSSPTQTSTLHEHPTSGTVLSMMPSLFETSLGHGPTAGTIRTAPNGICLRTSTWLLLYAMPFTVALCFLAFVLGKVETLWSKISCLIGAAICYMVCWALVVAIRDPDHEARAILERLDQDQRRRAILQAIQGGNSIADVGVPVVGGESTMDSSVASRAALELTRRRRTGGGLDYLSSSSSSSPSPSSPFISTDESGHRTETETEAEADPGWPYSVVAWVPHRYAQDIQNRLLDFSEMLDRVPDMMGEW